MAEISDHALMLAIQAIHQGCAQIEAGRAGLSQTQQADCDEIIESYELAVMELRAAYEQARLTAPDLPPYASLID